MCHVLPILLTYPVRRERLFFWLLRDLSVLLEILSKLGKSKVFSVIISWLRAGLALRLRFKLPLGARGRAGSMFLRFRH